MLVRAHARIVCPDELGTPGYAQAHLLWMFLAGAVQAGTQPGLLEQLRRCNEALEGVAKNLEVRRRGQA